MTTCEACGAGIEKLLPVGGSLYCPDCLPRASADLQAFLQTEEGQQAEWARVRRARSGLPRHLLAFRFEDVEMKPELAAAEGLARAWAEGEHNGVIISGNVGVGKTRLAAAATNRLLERRKVYFRSGPELMAFLGSGFNTPTRDEEIELLTGTAALVLDDLDKARPTEYAAEIIFLAINQRADGAAPLLITTNLGLGQLATRWPEPYGEAIASRLMLLEGVKVEGADRRQP